MIEMNRVYRTIAFVGLSSAPFAFSVERPADLDAKPHKLSSGAGEIVPVDEQAAQNWTPEKRIAIVEAIPGQITESREKEPAVVAVPYLGVGGEPIGEVLSSHLGTEHGILIQQVSEGSGAFKAGLLKNDVLLTLDGHEIATVLNLRDVVRGRAVGDEVTVEYIRAGERKTGQVVLEPRPQGLPQMNLQGSRNSGQFRQVWPQVGGFPDEAFKEIERLRKLMDQQFDDKHLDTKITELLNGGFPNAKQQIDLNVDAQSSATWSDGEGSITMNMRDGKTDVQVRDHQGAVVFEGPWDTAEDKAKASPEVQNRVENMGVQRRGNQFKFWMDGQPIKR